MYLFKQSIVSFKIKSNSDLVFKIGFYPKFQHIFNFLPNLVS